jgi:hypothetical protein
LVAYVAGCGGKLGDSSTGSGGSTSSELIVGDDCSVTSTQLATAPPTFLDGVKIAAGDAGFGAVWVDIDSYPPGIFFAAVDRGGELSVEAQSVPSTELASDAALVWIGNAYGLLWASRGSLHVSLLDESGNRVADDVNLPRDAANFIEELSVVWTGTSFALAWRSQGENQSYLSSIGSDGQQLAERPLAPTAQGVDLTWSGTRLGLVWLDTRHDGRDLYFSTFDAQLESQGSELRLSAEDPSEPEIAWDAESFGVAWGQLQAPESDPWTHLLRVSALGVPLGPELSWPGLFRALADDERGFGVLVQEDFDAPSAFLLRARGERTTQHAIEGALLGGAWKVGLVRSGSTWALSWVGGEAPLAPSLGALSCPP